MHELIEQIRTFAQERDWDQFHDPKNLSMTLAVEAAEIMEIFQWLSAEESWHLEGNRLGQLEEEIGDVMIVLTNLADKFGLDPVVAAQKKIKINSTRYPSTVVKGKAKKYTEY